MISKSKRTQIVANFKREVWESKKTFVWTPIVLAGVLLFLAALELMTLNEYQIQRLGVLIAKTTEGVAEETLQTVGFGLVYAITGIFLFIAFLLQLRYFLSCLFDERRDLSIFFWRSMPVSDVQNIAVKFVMGAFVIPIIFIAAAMAVIVIAFVVLLIYVSLNLLGDGDSIWQIVSTIDILSPMMSVWLAIVPVVLWLFPFYAWLMLASMVAGRAPFLWAFLPIAFLVLAEALVTFGFGTGSMYFSKAIEEYFSFSVVINKGIDTLFAANVIMSKVNIVALAIGGALMYATYWCRVNRSHE